MSDESIVIGTKQVKRALEQGILEEAILAEDADSALKNSLISDLEAAGVRFEMAQNMKDLGKAYGIQVGAAVVGKLKV